MKRRFEELTIREENSVLEAMKKINENKLGFLIVVDAEDVVLGVLTDGDIRRALIRGSSCEDAVLKNYTKNARLVKLSDSFTAVMEMFRNQAIRFLPIVNGDGRLCNVITKDQMHTLLLMDIHADLSYDFLSLDTSMIDYEVYQKPWGFYKTTVLNDYYQAKVISVRPGGQLSLQSHDHREEYWIVVHGAGTVQLDGSVLSLICGSTVFIPKGCKHRLTNTDPEENLIITEVQIGEHLGEDDIIRYEDAYGRV